MWASLSPLNGLSFVIALAVFAGPGYALFSFFPQRDRFDRTQSMALAISLSITFWELWLAWLHAVRIALSPISALVIFGLGWAIGLWRVQPWHRVRHVDWTRIALWLVIIITGIVGVSLLRDLPLGPGSDVYHHTLITRLIAERGLLPDNYLPYADLISFTYHFGFHGLSAAMVWLTGFDAVIVVPVVAQLMTAASALTVALLVEVATRRRLAGLVSALFTGLVCVFPAYFVNWGRDTQLTGLVILPALLAVAWCGIEAGLKWRGLPFIGLLAAGLALAHYRVTLMAASGFVMLFGVSGLMQHWPWREWRRVVTRLWVAAMIAGVLVAPWIWHVATSRWQGYPIEVGSVAPVFFSLDRLGNSVQNYPTNSIVVGLVALAILFGWWKRDRLVIGVSLWSIVMLVFSTPQFAGVFMDTVSVFISLYIPAAIVIGWLVTQLIGRWPQTQWAVYVGLVALSVWGAVTIGGIVDPASVYTTTADLQAMKWITANTPASARFIVNVFHVHFEENYITGEDTGYWLPLLANRAVFVPPLIYPLERAASPDFADRLVALSRAQDHLTTPDALALLRRESITHVYLGAKGTHISAAELLKSPDFKLVYQNQATQVFELVGTLESR